MPTAATRIGTMISNGLLPALLVCLLVMPAGLTGCQTTQKTASSKAASDMRQDERVLQQLENEYAIGPRKARSFGYRIGWQAPQGNKNLLKIFPQGDSVFTLSDENLLHRLTADSGTRIWTATAGTPGDNILGINYIPGINRVYVLRDGSIMTLDSGNGILALDKTDTPIQKLQWLANTAAVVLGDNLIYGARAGELVWHTYEIGFAFKAYKIGEHVNMKPLVTGDTVIGVASTGEIVAIDGRKLTKIWRQRVLDRVMAEPGVNDNALYVASMDQYLRAFSLVNGNILWRALTESPLRDSPTPLGSNVYQQIPGYGLACYEALPVNRFDGLRKWITPEITGSVVTTRGNNLITWDEEARQLGIISASTGTVEMIMNLDSVEMLITDKMEEGRIYTLDDRGRLDCLIPLAN
ncbi:MAG: hypothetical protein CMJ29_03790 [Phycisphaerae bacterium]|nr:hypothetical protein [Phycisphaerae bacterium]